MLKIKICANLQRIIKLFTQKNCHKLSNIWVWDPRSGIGKIPIPVKKITGSRIRIHNTAIIENLFVKKSLADPGYFPGSEFFPIPDLGSTSKNLSIQTQTIVFKLSEICSWLFIPDLDHDFYPSRFRIRKIDKNYLNSLIRIRDPGSMIVI